MRSSDDASRRVTIIVWILRLLVGATFIFSGFSKGVDPWGTFYKISEYFSVWHVDWVSRDVTLFLSAALSIGEFCTGVFILLGVLKRTAALAATVLMLIMLPLSAYIAIVNPVSDCGCFGDAITISNTATFLKNIVLTIAVVYLLKKNSHVKGLITPLLQWIAMVACVLYCIIIIIAGYNIQPMVDFRPYPVGSRLIPEDEATNLKMVYERDGVRQEFTVDNLPDSTWTFVERVGADKAAGSVFAIFDGDEEVTDDVINSEGPELILMVSDPGFHHRARASMANNLNDYITRRGGSMIGVVATSADSLDSWVMLTKPDFDIYTADDTSIKEVARGSAALVYLEDGVIKWKRNIYSLPGDFPDFETEGNALDTVFVIDSGKPVILISGALAAILLLLVLLSLPFRLVRHRKDDIAKAGVENAPRIETQADSLKEKEK